MHSSLLSASMFLPVKKVNQTEWITKVISNATIYENTNTFVFQKSTSNNNAHVVYFCSLEGNCHNSSSTT